MDYIKLIQEAREMTEKTSGWKFFLLWLLGVVWLLLAYGPSLIQAFR